MICQRKSSPFYEQGTEKGDRSRLRNNFCKNLTKKMRRSTKYKEINVCLLERKVLSNILRIFSTIALFQIKLFGA